METDSPVVYHGTSESRFPPEQIKKTQIQLSPEEIRVLKECNKESFYYRCLPFAIAGLAGSFIAVRNGYLRSHPRWGAAGKMTVAAFVGWFVGKFSYRSKCEDKFLKLENSIVGDAVRKRRGYSKETWVNDGGTQVSCQKSETQRRETGLFDSESTSQFPDEDPTFKGDSYRPIRSDDYNSSSASLNLDVDKNFQYSGLDDRERPSTDRENANFEKDETHRKTTSYEDLRRTNREEYERQHQSQMKTESSQNTPIRRQWGPIDSEKPKSAGGSKNAYGDAWENPNYTSGS